jgi:hypothetical protein
MKNRWIKIFIFCFLLTSCEEKINAVFEITNNTTHVIDSLSIFPNTNDKKTYISIDPARSLVYKSDMTSGAKVDGAYKISFLINGNRREQFFGYFSNGSPQERLTKIGIENDTIIFEPVYTNF